MTPAVPKDSIGLGDEQPQSESSGGLLSPPLHRALLILLFSLSLLLVSPELIPGYADLNPYDEAKYIYSGVELTWGHIREFSWGPLVALLYAPIYLAVRGFPDWFLWMAAAGRFILFTLLWLSTYSLAKQVGRQAPPAISLGMLFVIPSLLVLIPNPSYALFAVTSAWALSRLLSFQRSHDVRELWLGSIFVGLAALCRNDGIYLLPVFAALALIAARRKIRVRRIVLPILAPAAGVVLAFYLVARLVSGYSTLGMPQRAYESFEWAQWPMVGGTLDDAVQEARRLYGTPEENDYSVPRAILRNPAAFLERVARNLSILPEVILASFGNKRLAPLLLMLAAFGAYVLVRKREFLLLASFLVWVSPNLVYLGFIVREGYVLMSHFLPIVLGSIGLGVLTGGRVHRLERVAIGLILGALAAYGALDAKPAFLAAGIVGLAAWAFLRVVDRLPWPAASRQPVGLLIAFVAGLIMRGGYPFPAFEPVTDSPEARAVRFMQAHLPAGSRVGVPFPMPALAARMIPSEIGDGLVALRSEAELDAWLEDETIAAIYFDPRYLGTEPQSWDLIQSAIGGRLAPAFVADPGGIQVLTVR